jgi:hypothetical protein
VSQKRGAVYIWSNRVGRWVARADSGSGLSRGKGGGDWWGRERGSSGLGREPWMDRGSTRMGSSG